MRRIKIVALPASMATVLFFSSFARAQDDLPAENHYKVYNESAAEIPALIPLVLRDQFGSLNVDIIQRKRFATPASKDGSVVYDDTAHQSWFGIYAEQPERNVLVTDQFGTYLWTLGNAVYLVAPAVKYPQPGDAPPVRNHYLCYEATHGAEVVKPVMVIDQFGAVQVTVVIGKLFCNPVEKTTADGTVFPIVDSQAHLACYLVENPETYSIYVTVLDQFGSPEMTLVSNDCLCTPALKERALGVEKSTWGRIKALYRD
jgi:hypothetical protein